tara:strand:- start:117 stop:308 length:192 start_codon:yes stop_codon:yes gene_type:complete
MDNVKERGSQCISQLDTKLKKTYKENPKLNECITWFEWKYQDRELTSIDKSSIATILRYNSEE